MSELLILAGMLLMAGAALVADGPPNASHALCFLSGVVYSLAIAYAWHKGRGAKSPTSEKNCQPKGQL